MFIFDTVAKERELLEGPKEGIVGASGLQVGAARVSRAAGPCVLLSEHGEQAGERPAETSLVLLQQQRFGGGHV